jgi:hypothetical protein
MSGTHKDRQVDWQQVRALWDAMAPWREANPYATPQEIREAAACYLASMQPEEAGGSETSQPAPRGQETTEPLSVRFPVIALRAS